jgi:hypothetical protein
MNLGGRRQQRCDNDSEWGRHYIKVERFIKYLNNASNLTYAQLPVGRGARRDTPYALKLPTIPQAISC